MNRTCRVINSTEEKNTACSMRHSIYRRPRFAQSVLLVAQHNYAYVAVNLARTCDLTSSKSKQGFLYRRVKGGNHSHITVSFLAQFASQSRFLYMVASANQWSSSSLSVFSYSAGIRAAHCIVLCCLSLF